MSEHRKIKGCVNKCSYVLNVCTYTTPFKLPLSVYEYVAVCVGEA